VALEPSIRVSAGAFVLLSLAGAVDFCPLYLPANKNWVHRVPRRQPLAARSSRLLPPELILRTLGVRQAAA